MKKNNFKLFHFNLFLLISIIYFAAVILSSATMAFKTNEDAQTGAKNSNYLITLTKYEHGTENPLPNAVFELYQKDGAKIGTEYTTNEYGIIEIHGNDIEGLTDKGEYYFKEIQAPYGYVLNQTITYPFTHSEDFAQIDIVAYNEKATKDLMISKIVLGDTLLEKQEFTFTVTFGTESTNEYPYSINGESKGVIKSGQQLTLHAGETVVISGLVVGTPFNVIEDQTENYTTAYTSNTSGTIQEEENHAVFVNREDALQTTGLMISKIVLDKDVDVTKSFDFKAIVGDQEYSFSLKHGESYIIEEVEEGKPYVIVESNYSHDGYVTTSTGSVGTIQEGSNISLFTNQKKILEETDGKLTITKLLVGNEIDPNKEFEFIVTIGDQQETIRLKHGESFTFEKLKVNDHYLVREVDEGYHIQSIGATGTIQKNSSATFMNCSQEDNKENNLIITKGILGVKEDQEFTFHVKIGEETHDITLKHGQSYVFKDVNTGVNYEVVEDDYYSQGYVTQGYNASGTMSHGAKQVTFLNQNINKEMVVIHGQKTWDHGDNLASLHPTVIEVLLKADGFVVTRKIVTADENWEYQFKAPKYKVSDNMEVLYTIDEVHIPGYDKEINGYDLTNHYMPSVSIEPMIQKVITGDKPQSNTTFEFEMKRVTADAPMPMGSDENNAKIEIEGSGSKVFPLITYTDVGVYEYKVYEVKDSVVGYVYDQSEYVYKVTITAQENELMASQEIFKDDQPVDEMIFSNQYQSQEIKEYGNLVITKEVAGDLGDVNKEFDFNVSIDDIDYHFVLKHNESHTIENILVGSKYKVEEKNYVSEGYVTTSTGASGTIRKGINKATYTNTKTDVKKGKDNGSLTISKKVQGEVEEGKKFKFNVRIGEIVYVIELEDGQSKTFKDIQIGTSYSVDEHSYYHDGYETSSENSSGTILGDVSTKFTNRKIGKLSPTGNDHNIFTVVFMTLFLSLSFVVTIVLKRKALFE